MAASTERVVGGSGADVLTGAVDVANVLVGGPGADRLRLRSQDAAADSAQCGDGVDAVDADGLDTVADDCETLSVDGKQLRVGGESTSPRVELSRKSFTLRANGTLIVPLRCAQATFGRCTGRVLLAIPGGGRRITNEPGFRLLAGESRGVRVRVTRRDARALRRRYGRRLGVRIRVAASDARGNARVRRAFGVLNLPRRR